MYMFFDERRPAYLKNSSSCLHFVFEFLHIDKETIFWVQRNTTSCFALKI